MKNKLVGRDVNRDVDVSEIKSDSLQRNYICPWRHICKKYDEAESPVHLLRVFASCPPERRLHFLCNEAYFVALTVVQPFYELMTSANGRPMVLQPCNKFVADGRRRTLFLKLSFER